MSQPSGAPSDANRAAAESQGIGPGYWWARPAWAFGIVRPGLREAVAADVFRLRQLTGSIRTVLLPMFAIGVPVVVSILHATTTPNEQPPVDPLTVFIRDVYTESLPIMAATLAIGLASTAAGALLVLVYGIGNLAVTVFSNELGDNIPAAIFGRLVSYALLWLLAVEIPLAGRSATESTISHEGASIGTRRLGVVLGGLVVAALTFAWVQAAPLLITIVYWTNTQWGGGGFVAAISPLQETGDPLVAFAAAVGLLLLAVRYLGPIAVLSPRPLPTIWSRLPGGSAATSVIGAVAGLALLAGVVSTPIDAAILVVALVVARPAARRALSITKLGPPLAQIPGSIRLLIGFGAAAVSSWVILSIVGPGDWSRFSSAVIAIAVGLFVVAFFASADEFASAPIRQGRSGSAAKATIGLSVMLVFVGLAFPGAVLADNCGDFIDCFRELLRASLVVAGTAVLLGQRFGNGLLNTFLPPSYVQGGPLGPDRPEVPDAPPPAAPPPAMPPWYKHFLEHPESPAPPDSPLYRPPGPLLPPSSRPQQASPYDPVGPPGPN